MDAPSEKEVIRKKLFIREEDTLKKLSELLDKLSAFVQVEEKTGKIVLEQPTLSAKRQIFYVLAARYFANRAQGSEEYSLSLSEISEIVGKPITSLSGPVGDLVDEGYAEKVTQGRYQVTYHKIEKFLAG